MRGDLLVVCLVHQDICLVIGRASPRHLAGLGRSHRGTSCSPCWGLISQSSCSTRSCRVVCGRLAKLPHPFWSFVISFLRPEAEWNRAHSAVIAKPDSLAAAVVPQGTPGTR